MSTGNINIFHFILKLASLQTGFNSLNFYLNKHSVQRSSQMQCGATTKHTHNHFMAIIHVNLC